MGPKSPTLRRSVVVAVVLALTAVSLVVTANPTAADTDEVSGVLGPNDRTMHLVNVVGHDCGGALAPIVHYDEVAFEAPLTGSYNFLVTEGADFTAIYMYEGFDPDNPTVNCIRASNGEPPEFDVRLVAGKNYSLVIVDTTVPTGGGDQPGGAWTVRAITPSGVGGGGPPPTTDPTTPPTTTTPTTATTAPSQGVGSAVAPNPTFTG